MNKKNIKLILITFTIIFSFAKNTFALPQNEWVKVANDWYYMGENSQLVFNMWVAYNNELYHLGADGKLDTNKWIDNTYYVDNDGKMLKNTTTPDGYYVGADGKYVATSPITDSNVPQSSVIYSNKSITPNINNNTQGSIIAPIEHNTTQQIKNGFYIKYDTPYIDNDYYGDSEKKTYIKIIKPVVYYRGFISVSRTERLTGINDDLDEKMSEMFDDAISFATEYELKRYVIDKCSVKKYYYYGLQLLFEGKITTRYDGSMTIKFIYDYDFYSNSSTITYL